MEMRSKIEIYMAVLEVCRKPQIITHILYGTRINCVTLKVIIDKLVEKGLLKEVPATLFKRAVTTSGNQTSPKMYKNRKAWVTTSEGLELLKVFSVGMKLLKELDDNE